MFLFICNEFNNSKVNMGVEFNPNLMNQIGQNNFGSQKVSFGGLNGGNPFGGSSTKIGGNNSVFAQEIAEVGNIGMEKRAGFENGVGGTNYATEPTGNKLMFVA